MNETTIDVYGQVIPNTDLFLTAWYIYLVSIIFSTICDVYVIGAFITWAFMQKKCFEFSIVFLWILIVLLCAAPIAAIRWVVLLWKDVRIMIVRLAMCLVQIVIVLIRSHYAPSWEEIQQMNVFALGEAANLIVRALTIGSECVEIIVVSIMLSEVVRLHQQSDAL